MDNISEIFNRYKGYEVLDLDTQQVTEVLTGQRPLNLFENQYLVIRDASTGDIVDIRRNKNGELLPLKTFEIENYHLGKVKPRNLQQRMAFDLLGSKDVPLKIITGSYGSGKSFLALNFAFDLLENHKVDKIVYLRNNIAVKGTEALGALPGGEQDKMRPWVSPIIDIVGSYDEVLNLLEDNQLEVVPLAFLRGRSFDNSVMICDECENLTKELFQLIIGRAGNNTELWFLGDTRQSDYGTNRYKQFQDGTVFTIDRLKGNRMVGVMDLPKTERSALAALSNLLD